MAASAMTAPYINGSMIEVDAAAMTPVVNPASGKAFSKIFMARPEHMTRAIDAAYAVKDVWGNTTPSERELILIRAADVLESMRAEVVDLLIEEGGATFGKSQFEVSYVVGVLRSAAGECRRIMGQTMPCDIPGRISIAIRRPLGVVGGIAPFNFPLILATKKVAFALAAGNTFVLKPSEETSLVGLKIAEIFDKAGLPPGVLNVVTGDGPSLGEAMYSDPRVKAILFTGSTAVGRHIGIECARRGKKFDLEMGGKSPLLVMKDANLKYAVDTAAFGLFIHQGQICMAGSRIIVEEPVYEKFLEMFVAKVKTLKVGDPRDPHTVIGPLIRASQCPFIASRIDSAKADGARVVCGGTYEGNYFHPTVVADVRPTMAVFQEELFGPVASVIKATDADDAIQLANNTRYGLTSAVITNDLQLAMRCALELESGSVHINGSTIHDEPHAPFSGVKDSGMGREGGQWSMDDLTQLKWVTIQQGEAHYPF
ncbi:MAG TPA: aldehyde dehydrogenase family protein [Bryobacteraceae bacterium]|nr:aldehyde dehydrogenase family protein [Bryobacteraceae bacterium]